MDLLDSIEDRFDEMCEEFLDNIFEYETRAKREDFIKLTAEKQTYLFEPSGIRDKVVLMLETSYVSRRG